MKTLKKLQESKANPLFEINEIVDLNGVECLINSINYSSVVNKYNYSLYSINEEGHYIFHTNVYEDKLTKIDKK